MTRDFTLGWLREVPGVFRQGETFMEESPQIEAHEVQTKEIGVEA